MKIGIISDTHGLLRENALERLRACELILHAGDLGGAGILPALSAIAPTIAVRGNIDKGDWAKRLPDTELVEREDILIYILHDLTELDLEPSTAGISIVISGHSHSPKAVTKKDVLYLNPGSIGPRRFKLPISMATIDLTASTFRRKISWGCIPTESPAERSFRM